MAVHHEVLNVTTDRRPTFCDVTNSVIEAIKKSGIKDGIVNVYSQHTSCSILIQEESEDVTYTDTQLILQVLLNVFEKIIPSCHYEGQYLHPGPIHIKNAMELRDEKPEWGLNTDAHLRSVILGCSETIPLINGELTLGEFGRIYFADFDQTRERERKVRVQIVGE